MSVDFFDNTCSEELRNDIEFGLCDDENEHAAYSDTANECNWIATVKNDSEKEVVFTPIDNCIIIHKLNSLEKESTCDGMLTFENSIYLVELKDDRTGGYITTAIKQLKNTIKLIGENQLINQKYKKAFVCNKKKKHFVVLKSGRKRKFFTETNGFRLDVNRAIIIK